MKRDQSRKSEPAGAPDISRRLPLLVGCIIAALIAVAYIPVYSADFVNFDDGLFVYDNDHVKAGVTWEGIVWACGMYQGNWLPLSWLSHMLDCQLFGLWAGGHHATNVVIHAVNAILFFLLVCRFSKKVWPAAFAGALFGLHPIHVESVAWVAERKDVLSAFFWLFACHAYVSYAARPRLGRYLLVFLAMALGLMAKSMLVTLPCALLLLDVWPLRRLPVWSPRQATRLLLEKLPLLALAIALSIVAYTAQSRAGVVGDADAFPLPIRLGNAAVSYATYLLKTIVPYHLAFFHPHPGKSLSGGPVLFAAVALLAITGVVIRQRRRAYLAVGWCWYLGTLVPVIGIVQVGIQSHAYRYTYIPLMGVYAALAAGAGELLKQRPGAGKPLAVAAAAVVAACSALTWRQASHWQNNETLYTHAIAVTEGNHLAHNNLAAYYLIENRHAEALPHLDAALRFRPRYAEAMRNRALCLRGLNRSEDAIAAYQLWLQRVRGTPAYADGLVQTGHACYQAGRHEDAVRYYREARQYRPHDQLLAFFLGASLHYTKQYAAAIEQLSQPLALPDALTEQRFVLLGSAQQQLPDVAAAIRTYREGLARFPDSTGLLERAAYLEYRELKEYGPALTHYRRLLELDPDHAQAEQVRAVIDFLQRQ